MLSSVELDAIGLRKTPGLKNGEVRLDGILYQSPNEWTVWLNGQPCTFKNHPDGIVILEVTPHTVEFKQAERKGVDDFVDRDNGEDDEDDFEDDIALPEEEKVYNLSINQVIRLH